MTNTLFRPANSIFNIIIRGERALFPKKITSVVANYDDFIIVEKGPSMAKDLAFDHGEEVLWMQCLGGKNNDLMIRDDDRGCIETYVGIGGKTKKLAEHADLTSELIMFSFPLEVHNELKGKVPCGMFVPMGTRELGPYFSPTGVDIRKCAGAMDLGYCMFGLSLSVTNKPSEQCFTVPLPIVLLLADLPHCEIAMYIRKLAFSDGKIIEILPKCVPSFAMEIAKLSSYLDRTLAVHDNPELAKPEIQKLCFPPGDKRGPLYDKKGRAYWDSISESLDELLNLERSDADDWALSKALRVSSYPMLKEYESSGRSFYGMFSAINKRDWAVPELAEVPVGGGYVFSEYGTVISIGREKGGYLTTMIQRLEGIYRSKFPMAIMGEGIPEETGAYLSEALNLMADCLEEGASFCRVVQMEYQENHLQRWELPVKRDGAQKGEIPLSMIMGKGTRGSVKRDLLSFPLLMPPIECNLVLLLKIRRANNMLLSSSCGRQTELSGFASRIHQPKLVSPIAPLVSILDIPIQYVEGCRGVIFGSNGDGGTILYLTEPLFLSTRTCQQKFVARALSHTNTLPPDRMLCHMLDLKTVWTYMNSIKISELRNSHTVLRELPFSARTVSPSEGLTAEWHGETFQERVSMPQEFTCIDRAVSKKFEQAYRFSEEEDQEGIEIALPYNRPDESATAKLLSDEGPFFSRERILEGGDTVDCLIFRISDTRGISYLGPKLVTVKLIVDPHTINDSFVGRLRSGEEIVEEVSNKLESFCNMRARIMLKNHPLFRFPANRGDGLKLIYSKIEKEGRVRPTKTRLMAVQVNLGILFDNIRPSEPLVREKLPKDRYFMRVNSDTDSESFASLGEEMDIWIRECKSRSEYTRKKLDNNRRKIQSLMAQYQLGEITPQDIITLSRVGWFEADLKRILRIIKPPRKDAWSDTEDDPGERKTPEEEEEDAEDLREEVFEEIKREIPIVQQEVEIRKSTQQEEDLANEFAKRYPEIAPTQLEGKVTFYRYRDKISTEKYRLGGENEISLFWEGGVWNANPKRQVTEDRLKRKFSVPKMRCVKISEQRYECTVVLDELIQFHGIGTGKREAYYNTYRKIVLSGLVPLVVTRDKDLKKVEMAIFDANELTIVMKGGLLVGFDTEWDPVRKGPPTSIQVSFGGNVVLWIRGSSTEVPLWLKELFENPKIVKVGFDITTDIQKLRMLAIAPSSLFDIATVQHEFGLANLSLDGMSKIFLGSRKTVGKDEKLAFLEGTTFQSLTSTQRLYAAEDAELVMQIGLQLASTKVFRADMSGQYRLIKRTGSLRPKDAIMLPEINTGLQTVKLADVRGKPDRFLVSDGTFVAEAKFCDIGQRKEDAVIRVGALYRLDGRHHQTE